MRVRIVRTIWRIQDRLNNDRPMHGPRRTAYVILWRLWRGIAPEGV